MACKVTRYDCQRDVDKIKELAEIASTLENTEFHTIFPWKKQCDEPGNHLHYVAQAPNGTICGWLRAKVIDKYGRRYIFLNEISTRRVRDELYGGVGLSLNSALVKDAMTEGVDFIYLYPLNPEVASIYRRPEWGYARQRPEIVQLFRVLRNPPTREMLDKMMPPNPRSFMAAAYAIISQPPQDEALLKLFSRVRRRMIENPELIEELADAIMKVESVPMMEEEEGLPEEKRMSIDSKRAMIAEVLNKVKIGGRRRRTFKNKKHKKTRRLTRLRRFHRR
uniref:N-acetyltransferase domain-containing protein n=1 Tax=viral metagenome TaxID=1070528 RepID=A0A6C0B4F8_9ZZZZ